MKNHIVADPLSFISENYGFADSKFIIVGGPHDDSDSEYMLFKWLDDCDAYINRNKKISAWMIIILGIIGKYFKKNKKYEQT